MKDHINTWWVDIDVTARLNDWRTGKEGGVTCQTDRMTVKEDRLKVSQSVCLSKRVLKLIPWLVLVCTNM